MHAQDSLTYRPRYRTFILEKGSDRSLRVEFIRDTGIGIEVLPDSSYRTLTSAMMSKARLIPVEHIERITFQRRGGNSRGALIGGVGGLVLGVLATLPGPKDTDPLTATVAAAEIVAGAGIGLALGASLGVLIGSPKHRYPISGRQAEYDRIRPDLQFYRPQKVSR